MEDLLARNWGWMALRGALAVLFGIFIIRNPAMALVVLVLIFGVYAMADGFLSVASALANRHHEAHPVWLLLGGLAGIVIGICTFIVPGMTAALLILIIATWALVVGAAQIIAAIRLRSVIMGAALLGLTGVLSVLFGGLLLAQPVAGALAVVIWIGFYSVLSGVLLFALALSLRSWGRGHGAPTLRTA